MADDARDWPNYTDFGRIARLRASAGRIYVVVDPASRALLGEVLAAGGERWGADALEQLNEAHAAAQPRGGLARTRHAIQTWRPRGVGGGGGAGGGGAVQLWYRSTIRQHKVARRAVEAGAAAGVQDAAFVHEGQRVVLVHASWRAAAPHARPTEPALPGDDAARLHGRAFTVSSAVRQRADGRAPTPGRGTIGTRTALLTLAPAI